MKLKPGCGCLVSILAVLNLLLVVLALTGFIRGTMDRTPYAVVMVVIFVANVAVLAIVGLASIRRGQSKPSVATGDSEGIEGEEVEGDD